MTHKQITDRMIRIGLIVLPFFIFYGYRLMKGFEYPVVDDIMVNQTILSGDNMLLPYIGIMLSSALVFLQQLFTTWNVYFIFLALSFCLSFSVYLDSFFRKKLFFCSSPTCYTSNDFDEVFLVFSNRLFVVYSRDTFIVR